MYGNVKKIITVALVSLSLLACAEQNENAKNLSVGSVQREIRVGMAGDQVIQALGSPNIVTTDENRNEVWVYDKINTTSVYSQNQGSMGAAMFFVPAAAAGLFSGSFSRNSGSTSTSQKTLTITIKFDESKRVRDFNYHTSSF